MSIRAIRDDKQVQLTAQAVLCSSDSTYKLGAWIRDSMAGIGTVTYVDPDSRSLRRPGQWINDVGYPTAYASRRRDNPSCYCGREG